MLAGQRESCCKSCIGRVSCKCVTEYPLAVGNVALYIGRSIFTSVAFFGNFLKAPSLEYWATPLIAVSQGIATTVSSDAMVGGNKKDKLQVKLETAIAEETRLTGWRYAVNWGYFISGGYSMAMSGLSGFLFAITPCEYAGQKIFDIAKIEDDLRIYIPTLVFAVFILACAMYNFKCFTLPKVRMGAVYSLQTEGAHKWEYTWKKHWKPLLITYLHVLGTAIFSYYSTLASITAINTKILMRFFGANIFIPDILNEIISITSAVTAFTSNRLANIPSVNDLLNKKNAFSTQGLSCLAKALIKANLVLGIFPALNIAFGTIVSADSKVFKFFGDPYSPQVLIPSIIISLGSPIVSYAFNIRQSSAEFVNRRNPENIDQDGPLNVNASQQPADRIITSADANHSDEKDGKVTNGMADNSIREKLLGVNGNSNSKNSSPWRQWMCSFCPCQESRDAPADDRRNANHTRGVSYALVTDI